ncbi:MAG: ATP-binding protein [Gammaproteobacteria bacterium]|nr:ATP-binding protein [Gammaproteobacteria bacterium]
MGKKNIFWNIKYRFPNILFSNILRNAFNYTQHGKIEITLSNKTVSVTDSGVGMSPQQLKDAFQPFYRGNATDAPGVGLGLSIVKRLCERFNWELDAQSSPGEGTTVFIQFPQAEIIGGEPN